MWSKDVRCRCTLAGRWPTRRSYPSGRVAAILALGSTSVATVVTGFRPTDAVDGLLGSTVHGAVEDTCLFRCGVAWRVLEEANASSGGRLPRGSSCKWRRRVDRSVTTLANETLGSVSVSVSVAKSSAAVDAHVDARDAQVGDPDAPISLSFSLSLSLSLSHSHSLSLSLSLSFARRRRRVRIIRPPIRDGTFF